MSPNTLLPGDLTVWDGYVAMVVGNAMMVDAGNWAQLQCSRFRTGAIGAGGKWIGMNTTHATRRLVRRTLSALRAFPRSYSIGGIPKNRPGNVQQMTLLREFMTAENFPAAVNKLAKPICRRFDLPDVYQLGLVVPDALAADEAMVRDWGLDPSFMLDGEAALWIENGKELHVRGRLGFTYHQGYELELIEPRQGADFYARDLDPDGEIFLHHFGFVVRDLDLQTARLTSQGVSLLVRGRIHSGPLTADFSYLDTRGEFGLITELICTRFPGVHARIPPPLARYMGQRQTRSGKRALSI